METITLKELRNLVRLKAAKPLTAYKPDVFRQFVTLATSAGKYGINGALLANIEDNELYAVIGRKNALYYV